MLREFLVGVCRWQNYKPALVYGKWTENHTLTYGIPCEIRPMSIQNMQTKILFGGTIYKILRVWEWQVISSLLRSSIKNIPLVTDYLRKRYPSLRIQGSKKYPSQRLIPTNPHIVSTPPPSRDSYPINAIFSAAPRWPLILFTYVCIGYQWLY